MDMAVQNGRWKPAHPNILAKRSFLGHTLISMLVSARLAEVSPQGHGTGEPPHQGPVGGPSAHQNPPHLWLFLGYVIKI